MPQVFIVRILLPLQSWSELKDSYGLVYTDNPSTYSEPWYPNKYPLLLLDEFCDIDVSTVVAPPPSGLELHQTPLWGFHWNGLELDLILKNLSLGDTSAVSVWLVKLPKS